MTSQAQKKASAKYDKYNTRSILLKLNTTSDADILEKLDNEDNKQGYIKNLIRNDIRGNDEILSIEAIKLVLKPLIKKYDLKKVILFGSYARGEATKESDLDFLVECKNMNTMKEYAVLLESFKTATGKDVDIVMADTLLNKQTRAIKRLMDHIERDKVVIYE